MRYDYRAIAESGRICTGRAHAANPADLEMRLRHLGLELIAGHPARTDGGLFRRRIPRAELINFCFHLEQLLQAGVPILEGLADLRDSLDHAAFRAIVADMLEDIEGGLSLSQSMDEHPEAFDRVFVSLVRAGEGSGRLPEILATRAESLKWEDELAAATRRGLIYPGIVAAVALSAAAFLMVYLVPQLKLFVHNMGQALPLHTRALFRISALLGEHWPWLAAATLGLAMAARVAPARSPAIRRWVDRQKLRLPFIGKLLARIVLSRFATTFAMLYAAGIPVLEAIRQSQDFAGNHAIRTALAAVEGDIRAGSPIAGAFAATGLFPPLVVRMLRVGETTGSLDTALRNVSYFYTREVRESAARIQALIEPALTLFMGLLLGWIMLSVLGPIYDVIGRIKA